MTCLVRAITQELHFALFCQLMGGPSNNTLSSGLQTNRYRERGYFTMTVTIQLCYNVCNIRIVRMLAFCFVFVYISITLTGHVTTIRRSSMTLGFFPHNHVTRLMFLISVHNCNFWIYICIKYW